MAAQNRPVSPHLQIYRFMWTMALSITHRMTGMFLTIGTIFLVYWLVSIAAGEAAYATAQGLIVSWPGRLLLFAWTLAFYFHFCNGLRHLFWDAGQGLELSQARLSGYLAVVAAIILTVVTWVAAYLVDGGAL
ncbi:succinate dehydrogenase / fumarate reductase cytochrome b subunit [Natronospira proteinivora]|uniref:Succinate dehydrogenase cytochrome b556 subunit n=1 Tax=Natronospira proteinivora TaxID=1807133 RepID=A0ABT1G5X0_9GAMM|nr:succinate dehydrogenase, cytochrome b556 subunit [Natronospira proteinivora]MCP1726661.1 succinate dehydrogenase / fumarate reductase cytochrome b subunit [Natronospira proteinivora]